MLGRISLVVLLLAVGCSRSSEQTPVTLGVLPEFALVDQNEAEFAATDLDGSVWVTNFIFTSCQTRCPRLTGLMRGLQTDLKSQGSDVHFLSVSVDPETDTPAALKAYAEKYGADQTNWTFLTGDKAAVHELMAGFRVALEEPEHKGHDMHEKPDIIHSNHFVLLDKSRQIRGYYRTDHAGLKQLGKDAKLLVAQR